MTALLKATTSTWAAAVTGSQSAASLELATGRPVMAIGGQTVDDLSRKPATPGLGMNRAWPAGERGKTA